MSTLNGAGDIRPRPSWWPVVIAGGGFALGGALAAFLAGLAAAGLDTDQPGRVTWAILLSGVFLTGCLCWWLVIERPKRLSVARGAVAGVLTAVVCYPIIIGLAELSRRDGGPLDSAGERVLYVLQASGFALLTTGFGATLTLAILGMVGAFVLRPFYPARPVPEESTLIRRLLNAATIASLSLIVLLCVVFAGLTFWPLDAAGLARSRTQVRPAMSHADAIAAFEAVQAKEASLPLNPRCVSKLLTHGERVAEAVVFLHGFTNCPAQYDELAPELFARGYNIYVPLMPRHGEADQMTTALAGLTAEELVAMTDGAIDLAQGLGENVTVVGLSGGGTMTAWAGQYRVEADHTIAMAPFLGPYSVPPWANRAATNLLLLLPNVMVPWDPSEPYGPPAMDYAYPRFATHAAAQFLRLGEIVGASARRNAPLAPGLGMLINEADDAVSNVMAWRLVEAWQAHDRAVDVEVMSADLGAIHDLIDPRQELANTALVYPLVIKMIERRPQSDGASSPGGE